MRREKVWYSNKYDARYKFRIERSNVAITVQQKPPRDFIVWLGSIWGQWLQSRTSVSRSQSILEKLISTRPTTKWFKEHVNQL